MDLTDELEDLQELRDAVAGAIERADWVARYTEAPGVKNLALSVRTALAGVSDLHDAMVQAVLAAGGSDG